MNENTNPLTESYPTLSVSDDLRMRVKRLAAQSEPKPARTTPRRFALALGAAVVLGGGAFFQPRIATAVALTRMNVAMEGVKTAHVTSWQMRSLSDTSKTYSETWFRGDQVRLKDERQIQIFREGKNYFYSPERNRVVVKSAQGAATFNSSGFSVAALKRDIAQWGWSDRIETLGEVSERGKTYKKFALYRDEPAGKVRVIFLVDPKTDLPQRSEMSLLPKDGTWEVRGGSELRYNEALDPKLFNPVFPGATVVDYDQEKKHWKAALENTVAKIQVGERTVAIRDIRVNEQGAIFVLYTCGKTYDDAFHKSLGSADWWPGTSRDWSVSLTDAEGTIYTPREIHFEGVVGKERKRENLGNRPVLLDGELLQGDWFIPTTPTVKQPSSVTLRVHLSGSAKGTLTLTPTPQSDFLPDYWPHVVTSISDGETELRQQYEETRSSLLETHRATLPQALEAVLTEEALTPEPGHALLLKKARVLGLLARPDEAKQALAQAIVRFEKECQLYSFARNDDYFFWEQVCTAWYAIGDEAKAIEARDKAFALAKRQFPGRIKWYQEHPEDLKPKLD